MKVLLVEPNFPYPTKSKNKAGTVHKNFIPIALLKFASLYKSKGYDVKLVRGILGVSELKYHPDLIIITSIFTYWSKYVWETVRHYRKIFPKSEINLGGIYATLHAEKESFKKLAEELEVKVFKGLHSEAEKYLPDYTLVPDVEYHATHMMRGCIRKCAFCGTWKIEPNQFFKTKEKIINELIYVNKNKVIFYDNNMLANPDIKNILKEFQTLRINNRPVKFESQSGFDGRLLEKDPELVELIKLARFTNVRIAWDNGLSDNESIEKQIQLLIKAGYVAKDISIFMIYNFNITFEEMIRKVKFCKKWGVQINDCRYRPLFVEYDDYNPHTKKGQTERSYYIHSQSGWTDDKIRKFRHEVRIHNIWIRYAKDKGLSYDKKMERWSSINNLYKFFNLGKPPLMDDIENNKLFHKKIMLLNKIKKYCKETDLNPKKIDLKFNLKFLRNYVKNIC